MSDAKKRLDLRSLCSFSTGTLLWQQRPREWSLSLCVKGTFALVPGGEAVLADVQRPVRAAVGHDEAALAPSDFAPIKPRVDVIVAARAPAPSLSKTDLHVRVGGVDKRIALPGAHPDQAAPIRSLGPTTLAWRASQLGLSDAARAWVAGALRGTPDGVAPEDLDFAVFNEAPPDQQCDVLRRREAILLNGLGAGHPAFEGRLPGLWPKVLQFPPRGLPTEVGMRCDTLLVDAEHALAILWWRGLIPVPRGDLGALGALVVVAEEVSRRAIVEVIEQWVRTPGAPPPTSFLQDATATSLSPLAQRSDRIKKSEPPVDDLDAPTTKMAAPRIEAEQATVEITTDVPPEVLERPEPPLPFAPPKKAAVEVTTDALPAAMLRPHLPFARPPERVAPPANDPLESRPVEPPRLGPPLLHADSFDVAEVATIAAKLASGSAKNALAARGLTADTWSAVERRCLERLANEAEEGRAELRDEYDEAFLAAEALRRGPFEIAELARLRVALEADEPDNEDAGLALDVAAAMRVRRLWARRAASDPTLAKSLDAAMEKERERRKAR